MLEIGVCFAHRQVLVQHLEESPEVRGAPITMRALPCSTISSSAALALTRSVIFASPFQRKSADPAWARGGKLLPTRHDLPRRHGRLGMGQRFAQTLGTDGILEHHTLGSLREQEVAQRAL